MLIYDTIIDEPVLCFWSMK